MIVYGENREHCLARLRRALDEYVITGIDTLIPLHRRLANNEKVINADFDIHFLEEFCHLGE